MIYRVAKWIVRPIFFFIYRIKLIGKENLKHQGKMILIANHVSGKDPIFMHLIMKQKIYYMSKKELFKNPFVSWLVRWLGAFPVDRGKGDLGAIKTALQVLDEGKTMGIFPEGRRNLTGNGVIAPFQHGAAMIALRSDAPILPVYISPVRPFHRTYLVVGKPIDLKKTSFSDTKLYNSETVKAVSEYLRDKVVELKLQVAK